MHGTPEDTIPSHAVGNVGRLDEVDIASVARRKMVGRIGRALALGLLTVATIWGGRIAYAARSYEETDNAQIEGDISTVSPRVAGTIKEVRVSDNQVVAAGQVLAVIDAAELDIALAQSRANLAQAEALERAEDPTLAIAESSNGASVSIAGSEFASATTEMAEAAANQKRGRAQLARAEVQKRIASMELERSMKLVERGVNTRAELDAKTAAFDAETAAVEAALQEISAADERLRRAHAHISAARSRRTEARENAPRQLEVKKALLDMRRAHVAVAREQLAQAQLNLEYAKIVAPIAGILGRKAVGVGDHVRPGQPLFAVTSTNKLWVTANFRETQIRMIAPGQRVVVHVDALDRDFIGSVESLAGATGARFALLPPENASGNYVKVVQRIPVRIQLGEGQPEYARLRCGMSVEPRVRVR